MARVKSNSCDPDWAILYDNGVHEVVGEVKGKSTGVSGGMVSRLKLR